MSYPPSMVHKSGDQLVVRSVVSGNKLFGTSEYEDDVDMDSSGVSAENHVNDQTSSTGAASKTYQVSGEPDEELPQCKVKRNYACSSCSYYTQNPRYYLHHLKNVHQEKIRIYECPSCLYASKHSQKLQRHIHMVHVMGKRKMLIKAKTTAAATAVATPAPKPMPPTTVKKEVTHNNEANLQLLLDSNAERNVVAAAPEKTILPKPSPDSRADNSSLQMSSEMEVDDEEEVGGGSAADESQSDQPIKCSLCSFSSRNPNLVTRHERLVHLKKKFYRCSKCDYITHMKARFTKHVKYHSMPMIKCEMCDFRTPYKWNLDRHNKNHFANGAFKCSQCNFTADIKQSLTVHEMNHHVPPINQNGGNGQPMVVPAKRRCRVGASDIMDQQEATSAEAADLDDLELLRMERESLPTLSAEEYENTEDVESSAMSDEAAQLAAVEVTMVKPNASPSGKTLNLKNPTAAAYLNGILKPEDVILTKNGSVYVKKFKCRVCQYKAAWESEMIRHEVRVHGLDSAAAKKKPLPRPIPNLIPLQNNSGPGNGGGSSASSSTAASPSHSSAATSTPVTTSKSKSNATKNSSSVSSSPMRNGLNLVDLECDKPLTEKDLNEIYSKSCATSSLKDFASLIGTEESTLKSDKFKDFVSMFSLPAVEEKEPTKKTSAETTKPVVENDTQPTAAVPDGKKLPDAFKKKNASFFDRLKEKLMVGAGESHNLSCWCGYQSKCLSESVLHQKTHSESAHEKSDKSISNGPLISGADLKSTRCQHCRQRCKTSSDLFAHLQSCPEMNKKETLNSHATVDVHQRNGDLEHSSTTNDVDDSMPMDEDHNMDDLSHELEDFPENSQDTGRQTNRVFVWNSFLHDKEDGGEEYAEDEYRSKSPASESSLVGYEIAPGIGSVMPSTNEEATESFKEMNIDLQNVETTTKKVFKCPTCSFWASTASRFHVHVVSHMNVKPFGCSVCPYQSKWKWDVTKHIKLKRERDPTHEGAEMRTIDVETGRRNYTKYNRFLTAMRVHEPRIDVSSAALKSAAASVSSQPSPPVVPLLPKLTPAPSINGDATDVGDADVMMRPLPQLHPANPSLTTTTKRSHGSAPQDESEPPKKKMSGEKKMWKCKKCKFRNTDKNIVLAHVKEHYTSNAQTANSSHGFADKASSMEGADSTNGENHVSVNGIIHCKSCNFETDNPTTFHIHNSHHVEDLSAAFRCCFCPFFANDKPFMINHISTHGVNNPEELVVVNARNNEESYRKDDYDDKMETSADEQGMGEMSDGNLTKSDAGAGDEMEIYKRFKCANCPYVTNNKSQYLYHKQFHRLRDAPFKCNICSYNVTKRHLLHQHLKIHGVNRSQFKNCLKAAAETKSVDEEGMKLNTDIDTAHLPDVPLVWVHKSGTLTKMFKCRHCPHVNLRKSNIHEHEKMHFDRLQRSPNGSITTGQVSTHHCADCNYVCNNAGALASHAKVHQGAFGQICALADPRRSDESQIREITRLFKEDERFKKEPPPPPKPESLEKRLMPQQQQQQPADLLHTSLGHGGEASGVEAAVTAPPPTGRMETKSLFFCHSCPARFFYQKDLDSHTRFHGTHHDFKCNSCSYSAPMQAQLLAHDRVHSDDYHEKTNTLAQKCAMSRDFPRPRTTRLTNKPGFPSLGWVVMMPTSQQKKEEEGGVKVTTKAAPVKQFSCHKCPAQFFKSVALQHHLTLHGGKDPHQCRVCDYRVKTYGNLIKHEVVHGLAPRLKAKVLKSKQKMNFIPAPISDCSTSTMNASSIPCSGTELFQHRSEQMMREQPGSTPTPVPPAPQTPLPYVIPTPPTAETIAAAGLSADPEFGIYIHGSPDFIYPQTVKNGKLKEKRYKCHKCPSAFEKREQYKTHCSLHGAKSRFRCEKCDYSVKYFANYTQHMRKHDNNERFQSERQASLEQQAKVDGSFDEMGVEASAAADVGSFAFGFANRSGGGTGEESAAESHASSSYTSPNKSLASAHSTPMATPSKAAKTLHISVADQQAVVLMQEKISDFGVNMADQLHRCYYCPYSHQRKDAVENHERCHFNGKGSYVCDFCNYTVPQPHFLREHQKLHFGAMKGIKPEAYMKCDRLEIWMETEEGKVLIFKDSGRKESRFEPPVTVNEEESEFKKMYVDVRTGEECTPYKSESNFEAEDVGQHLVVPKPDFDSVAEPVSESGLELKDVLVDVKEEPVDENDDSTKVNGVEDEDYLKLVEGAEEEPENMDEDVDEEEAGDEDEEEDLDYIDKDDNDVEVEAGAVNGVAAEGEETDYDPGSDDIGESDDDPEFEDADQSTRTVYEMDGNDDGENLDEASTLKVEAPDLKVEAVSEGDGTLTSTDATKTEDSDDSDSEDSESSSSSSSCSGSASGSGSSCTSSDSSDEEEKERNRSKANGTTRKGADAAALPEE